MPITAAMAATIARGLREHTVRPSFEGDCGNPSANSMSLAAPLGHEACCPWRVIAMDRSKGTVD